MAVDPDWSELPPELLQTIANTLTILADHVRFRAVCKTWRSSAAGAPANLPVQLPWLMLPESHSHQTHRRGFVNLLDNKLLFLNLPEASFRRRRCGSSHGWLVILDESPAIFVVNPLTRGKVDFPPLTQFPNIIAFDFSNVGREYTLQSSEGGLYNYSLKDMRDLYIKKLVLSDSPLKNPNCIAFAIINLTGELAYCKNGEKRWRFVDDARSYCEDVVYFNGLFYAVDNFGDVAVCDVSGDSPTVSFIRLPKLTGGDMKYLVKDMDDRLLLVTRSLEFYLGAENQQLDFACKTTGFQVFRLNLGGPVWDEVWSLDDLVIFLGQNSSLALRASDFLGCKGNRIFFTDDYSEGNYDGFTGDDDLGVYNLEDGTVEALPCYPHDSQSRFCWPPSPPAIWITPNPY